MLRTVYGDDDRYFETYWSRVGPETYLVGDAAIREHVAAQIGKLARRKRILWAHDLLKTRSGKIMRRLLRDIANGRTLGDVTTLRHPAVMADLEQKVTAARTGEG